jgi:pimeloyl-ACP methyl ester carboxylesterase
VQSFKWALDNESWRSRAETFKPALDAAAKDEGEAVNAAFVRKFYDRVVPGIYGQFDGPAMLPLIAPRPLLVINGDTDPRTPMPGLQECLTAARTAYRAAGAEPKLQVILQPQTGHKVTVEARQAAVDWFVKWLRP